MKYDVIVAGGGVVGIAILDELAKYRLSVLLLEGADDVATGASRANSGIVHAGYDCKPNTMKARFNREGNARFPSLVKELDVPYVNCGSLVVATEDKLCELQALKARGDENGIQTEILGSAALRAIEPNVADDVAYALHAPTAGIVSPYKLTIALADRAVTNGAEIRLSEPVTGIEKTSGGFVVTTPKGTYSCDVFINSAGQGAAALNDAAGAEHFDVTYQRGDYFVLDQTERQNINTVIFPLPTKLGKGILAAPTADGNVIYGPTGIYTEKGDSSVTAEGLATIKTQLPRTYKTPAYRKVIRLYSGLRCISGDDFHVAKSSLVEGFIYLVGICSPGLSSAPAIAKYVVDGIFSTFKPLVLKENYIIDMPRHKKMTQLSAAEINALVQENAEWGRIVCRCEKVTEAEIVAAIKSPLPATTVDAVKRRVRAGMGRCQGGFCEPRVIDILARELGVPVTSIRKGGEGSEIALFRVKGGNV